MTVIHIVLFRLSPLTTPSQKTLFLTNLKSLSTLPSVKDQRFIIGQQSISQPNEVSKGFDVALVSFHESREMLEEYQEGREHVWVKENFINPIKEEIIRFDFEVQEEDEWCVGVVEKLVGGLGVGK